MSVLSLLTTRTNYTKYAPHIQEHAVSKEVYTIIKAIGEYYKLYVGKDVLDWEELKMFFFMLHSKVKGDEYVLYEKLLNDAATSAAPTGAVVDDVLKNLVKRDYTTRIFNTAHQMLTQEKGDMDDIELLIQDYRKEVGHIIKKEELFTPFSLRSVMDKVTAEGYNWRLTELNKSLGPLRNGDFIVIAARPETGKTTFAASECSYMAHQFKDSERPLLWFNNEEQSEKVTLRIMQAYFGVTSHELELNMEMYEERWQKEMGGRIVVLGDDSGYDSVSKLESVFADVNPRFILFDQLDKVKGFYKSERDDLRIGSLYQWARTLAKKYGPVIAISQVDGTGEGMQWIQMNQLRGSKTDKVGEADAIVTIGKQNDGSKEYHRYIHVPKNKLYGGAMSEEHFRHGYFEVYIQPEIARYKGVM